MLAGLWTSRFLLLHSIITLQTVDLDENVSPCAYQVFSVSSPYGYVDSLPIHWRAANGSGEKVSVGG